MCSWYTCEQSPTPSFFLMPPGGKRSMPEIHPGQPSPSGGRLKACVAKHALLGASLSSPSPMGGGRRDSRAWVPNDTTPACDRRGTGAEEEGSQWVDQACGSSLARPYVTPFGMWVCVLTHVVRGSRPPSRPTPQPCHPPGTSTPATPSAAQQG